MNAHKSKHRTARTRTALADDRPCLPGLQRWLGIAAVTMAAAFVLVLGVRTLTTEDLGYHLTYGEHFLSTGQIVDDSRGVYQLVPQDRLRYELPPGAWLDSSGRYRFPNANWLSQVVMALTYRAGGMVGLSVLLAAMSAGIFALLAATMRRLGLGTIAIAAGMLLTAMASYERILLRPEVFGYLVLIAMLYLLVGGRLTRASAVALVGLQLLLVNLHSYFLLGLGLTGAFAAENLLRRLWRHVRRSNGDANKTSAPPAGKLLWLVLGAQVLACFANPWTWRLAALPIQTLFFMRRHGIAGGAFTEFGHPWAVIGEFFRPFAPGVFENSVVSNVYVALLAIAIVGALCAAYMRRWAHLLLMTAMTAASLTMRRNIAPAAILIIPPAFSACQSVLGPLATRWLDGKRRGMAALLVAALLGIACGVGVWGVVTQRFYRNDRRATRFGLGVTQTAMPLSAADWINNAAPVGRLWTDYNTSSNLYWFVQPHRKLPVLTNTWAYPPDSMEVVLAVSRGRMDYRKVLDGLKVEIVTLRMDRTSIPLARKLAGDTNWVLVDLDAVHATFLRTNGANAKLAREAQITPESLDVIALARRLAAMDPVGSFPTYLGSFTLAHLGWNTQAIEVMDYVLAHWPNEPHLARVWNMKGTCLAQRGTQEFLQTPPDVQAGRKDWKNARECFIKALELDADYKPAAINLQQLDRDIADEKRGIINRRPG